MDFDNFHILNQLMILNFRHTMSGISLDTTKGRRAYIKDFCVATPEEYVKCFGGDVVINKVKCFHCIW